MDNKKQRMTLNPFVFSLSLILFAAVVHAEEGVFTLNPDAMKDTAATTEAVSSDQGKASETVLSGGEKITTSDMAGIVPVVQGEYTYTPPVVQGDYTYAAPAQTAATNADIAVLSSGKDMVDNAALKDALKDIPAVGLEPAGSNDTGIFSSGETKKEGSGNKADGEMPSNDGENPVSPVLGEAAAGSPVSAAKPAAEAGEKPRPPRPPKTQAYGYTELTPQVYSTNSEVPLVIDNVHFDKNAVSEVVMNDGKYSGEKQPVKNMYISEEDQIVELMFDDVNYIDPDTKDLFYDPVKGTHAEKKEMIKLEYDNVNFVKPDADKKQIERFNVTSKYADMKAGVLRDAKNSHLGVPYKAGSYTTETSGEENIRTKSLGTPYTIRTKLQEEAIRRGY